MAGRAAERRRQREAAEAEREAAERTALLTRRLDPDMPDGHEAHHWHARGNGYDCSCGQLHGGIWLLIP